MRHVANLVRGSCRRKPSSLRAMLAGTYCRMLLFSRPQARNLGVCGIRSNVDPGTSPTVYVQLDSKGRKIRISDNGRGMTLEGLQNFFVMHGEDLDRKSGVPGRGRFGTGKSAAFGIGDLLRVTSVRDSRRSVVELTRSDLDRVSSGDPIPVRVLVSEVACSEANGTTVRSSRFISGRWISQEVSAT